MRVLVGGWLVLAPVVMFATVGPLEAEPKYRERVEYFDISGHVNSRREIWDAIRDWGPSRNRNSYNLNDVVVGTAQPRIGYSFKTRRRGGRCEFSELKVSVAVKLRLPAWDLKDFAKPDLKRYFGCILRTVTVHEKQHAQISCEAGERIEAKFYDRLNGSQCKGFVERAKSIYQDVRAEYRRRQADFDRRDYARRRYQDCNTGAGGPSVNLRSRPKRSRLASRSVPTRRFDVEPAGQPKQAERSRGEAPGHEASRREAPARVDNTQQEPRSISFGTTKKLLGSAGYMIVAAASIFGLFVAFMWGASSYEKRRELEALTGGVDEATPEDGGLPAPANRVSIPAGSRQVRSNGFGKRVRK